LLASTDETQRFRSCLPEGPRAAAILTREWVSASYRKVGIDYLMNYTFHGDDLDAWDGATSWQQ
jgi:hypothetical protein